VSGPPGQQAAFCRNEWLFKKTKAPKVLGIASIFAVVFADYFNEA
jgi:hypothetical protein